MITNDDSNGPLCLDSLIDSYNPSNLETGREALKNKHFQNKQESNQSTIHQLTSPTQFSSAE